MTESPDAARGQASRRGFALIIVLWGLVLLALLGTAIGGSGRSTSKITRNLLSNAEAEAAADGAVFQTAFHLMDSSDGAWKPGGPARELRIGNIPVTVEIADTAGKINPNTAQAPVLQALLTVLGQPQDRAQALALAIIAWRGGDQTITQEALADSYRAAGISYLPPRLPFESIEEIGLVQGMTPALFAQLEPHLSIDQTAPADPAAADPIVRQAMSRLPTPPPAPPPSPFTLRTLVVQATATGPGDARFTRRAVLRLGPSLPQGYAVIRWEAPAS
jgi:general secretion pathway protein K